MVKSTKPSGIPPGGVTGLDPAAAAINRENTAKKKHKVLFLICTRSGQQAFGVFLKHGDEGKHTRTVITRQQNNSAGLARRSVGNAGRPKKTLTEKMSMAAGCRPGAFVQGLG